MKAANGPKSRPNEARASATDEAGRPLVLGVRRSLGNGDIAGLLYETGELAIRHRRLIDPESVNRNPAKSVEINTTLRTEGYYYGHGVTSRGALAMRLGAVELSATATFAAIWSLNGRDHNQGKLDADLSAFDTRSSRAVTAGAAVA